MNTPPYVHQDSIIAYLRDDIISDIQGYYRTLGFNKCDHDVGLDRAIGIIRHHIRCRYAKLVHTNRWCEISDYDESFYLLPKCHSSKSNQYDLRFEKHPETERVFCPICGGRWMVDFDYGFAWVEDWPTQLDETLAPGG